MLLKLAQRFAIDIEMFNAADEGALLGDLMEAFADPLFDAQGIKAGDLKELGRHRAECRPRGADTLPRDARPA